MATTVEYVALSAIRTCKLLLGRGYFASVNRELLVDLSVRFPQRKVMEGNEIWGLVSFYILWPHNLVFFSLQFLQSFLLVGVGDKNRI